MRVNCPPIPEQALFNAVLCGIVRFTFDEEPRILQFNSACAQIYGYKDREDFDQYLGDSWDRLVYFYDKEILRGFIRRCVRTGRRVNFGHRIQRHDGGIAYIMGEMSPVQLDDGSTILQTIFMDSGHRVVQEDIRKSILYQPVRNSGNVKKIVCAGSEHVRGELKAILQKDYRVIEAQNESEVLSILGKEKDDIAAMLLDMDIMDRGDFRFMASLKSSALYASIPVVIVANQNCGDEEQLLAYGANDFFRLPFNARVLRLRLSNLIELRDTAIQRNSIETMIKNIPGCVIMFRALQQVELLFYSSNTASLGISEATLKSIDIKDATNIVFSRDRARVTACIAEAASTGSPFEVTFRIENSNGVLAWQHMHAVKVRDDHGPVYQAIVSPTSSHEKMYQGALDDSFCAIAVNDAVTGEPLYLNNSAANLLSVCGASSADSSERNVPWNVYSNSELSRDRYASRQTTACNGTLHLIMNAKLTEWNGIDARIVYATDDTESYRQQNTRLEKALEEARQANAAKSAFLSRMSHDIRTPMNAILGMSTLAQDNAESADAIQGYLRNISSSGEYLLGLINDILDMSRIESERVKLVLEPYTIRECVDFVMVSMRSQIDMKNINFTFREAPCARDAVMLDKMRSQQIFFNLISNAVKFTGDGGHIDVSVDCTAHTATTVNYTIIVKDDGIGIDQASIERIFEPFEQARATDDTEQRGSGLGLAIVRNLVSLMNGTIHAESRIGHGSRFIIEAILTLAPDAIVSAQPDGSAPVAEEFDFTGKKVLLVEDQPINREIARKMLEKKGCQVQCAENGRIAVEALENSAPGDFDGVLMDIRMPVMNGLDATRCIRASVRDDLKVIPIVAMSANAFSEDVQKSLDAGMNYHLVKPIDIGMLYRTLNSLWE